MRRVVALFAAPVLAALALTVVFAFPSPRDLVAALTPVEREINIVQGGGLDAQTTLTNLSSELPTNAARITENNGDCFQDLALAGKDKLERCAAVVYQALIDVEKVRGQGLVREALDPNRARAFEQLRYAAVEVCRNQWANQPIDAKLDQQPACRASQIEIASTRE